MQLYANCVKQYEKTPEIVEQSVILHYNNALAYTSLLIRDFLTQKQHRNQASAIVFTGLEPARIFPFLKSEMISEKRLATIENMARRDQSNTK